MKFNLLLLLAIISSSYGYHILVLAPTPTHSHNTLAKGIVDALLMGGHEVTWTTPYPDKVRNPPKTLHILNISSVHNFLADEKIDYPKFKSIRLVFAKRAFLNDVSMEMINSPSVREALIRQQFDAVVTEPIFGDMLAGAAAVQRAPWIMLATQMHPLIEGRIDEVRSVATTPLMPNPSEIPMPFFKRAINGMIYTGMIILRWFDRPNTIRLYEKTFAPIAAARGVTLPPFDDAFYNVSIVFVNSHEALTPAYSTPPNVVNIAGYHIDDNIPPLPKDLQELLDGSPQGVIYFSMGSVLKSTMLKPDTRAALLQLFSTLPYTVLWKFEEPLPGLPPNVHVRSWMPQPSILAHKNIKVFITHGGQLSLLEALHAGVPLLAVPVTGDQPSNAERAVRLGYALKVDFSPDMVPELEVALKEILSNDKYLKRAKYLSHLFQSRPVQPKQLINYYVTLAIETKGAYHLRSPSLKYSWYERCMLDVVLALLAVLVVLIVLLKFLIKTIHNCLRKEIKSKEDLERKSE